MNLFNNEDLGVHFKIPDALADAIRSDKQLKKNDSKINGSDSSKLTYLKGGDKRENSIKEETKRMITSVENWEELTAAENISIIESAVPELSPSVQPQRRNDENILSEWESFPEFAAPGEEPVLIVNLRYLYGANLCEGKAAIFVKQLHQILHEDFPRRSAELFELDDMCYHSTTTKCDKVREDLQNATGDSFAVIMYPRYLQGQKLEHLWWQVKRPSQTKSVELLKGFLRETNQDLLWKANVSEALESLARDERARNMEWQHKKFKKERETHILKLEEVVSLFEERLREAQAEAFKEKLQFGYVRPVTEALVNQVESKLNQILLLLEDLNQPEEPEPTLSDFDPDEWETDSDGSSSEGRKRHDEGYDAGEEEESFTMEQPRRKTKRLRRKIKYRIPEIEDKQTDTQELIHRRSIHKVSDPPQQESLSGSGSLLTEGKRPSSERTELKETTGSPEHIDNKTKASTILKSKPGIFVPAWKWKKEKGLIEAARSHVKEEDCCTRTPNEQTDKSSSPFNSRDPASGNQIHDFGVDEMTILDQLVAMILGRYPKRPHLSAQDHFQWMADSHQRIRDCWIEEFGCLPGKDVVTNC